MRVVIIASLSQEEYIAQTVQYLKHMGYEVDYPTKQPDKEFGAIVEEYLYKISNADQVVAITKDNGTFGEGACYELAFSIYLNKPIKIIDRSKNEDLQFHRKEK